MSEFFRHPVAHRGGAADTHIIFVPVEVPAAGSPKSLREVKPSRPYPSNQRQPWRPAQHPPSKAQRTIRFLDAIVKQEAEVPEFMQKARAAGAR